MFSRRHLSIVLGATAVALAILLVADGLWTRFTVLRALSVAVGLLVLLLVVCERWAWRWQFLHPWFVSTPVLRGTWKGQVESTWIDPSTGQPIPPIEAYLAVSQTASTIRMNLMMKKSGSELLGATIVEGQDGVSRLFGTYRGGLRDDNGHRRQSHHGGLFVEIHGDPPGYLEGQYWTNRRTTGSLRFEKHDPRIYEEFEEATRGEYRK